MFIKGYITRQCILLAYIYMCVHRGHAQVMCTCYTCKAQTTPHWLKRLQKIKQQFLSFPQPFPSLSLHNNVPSSLHKGRLSPCHKLDKGVSVHPCCAYMVTSRPHFYIPTLKPWRPLSLWPLVALCKSVAPMFNPRSLFVQVLFVQRQKLVSILKGERQSTTP